MATRFPIRFEPTYRRISSLLLISPSDSYLEIDAAQVSVRMAWSFRSRFPRAAVATVAVSDERPLSRGVHGFRGRWLVNGSGQGIVVIDLDPVQGAYVLGFPVRLRQLRVSVEEPQRLMSALDRDGPRP
jgi:hypothetical protein